MDNDGWRLKFACCAVMYLKRRVARFVPWTIKFMHQMKERGKRRILRLVARCGVV